MASIHLLLYVSDLLCGETFYYPNNKLRTSSENLGVHMRRGEGLCCYFLVERLECEKSTCGCYNITLHEYLPLLFLKQ